MCACNKVENAIHSGLGGAFWQDEHSEAQDGQPFPRGWVWQGGSPIISKGAGAEEAGVQRNGQYSREGGERRDFWQLLWMGSFEERDRCLNRIFCCGLCHVILTSRQQCPLRKIWQIWGMTSTLHRGEGRWGWPDGLAVHLCFDVHTTTHISPFTLWLEYAFSKIYAFSIIFI